MNDPLDQGGVTLNQTTVSLFPWRWFSVVRLPNHSRRKKKVESCGYGEWRSTGEARMGKRAGETTEGTEERSDVTATRGRCCPTISPGLLENGGVQGFCVSSGFHSHSTLPQLPDTFHLLGVPSGHPENELRDHWTLTPV